MLNSTVVPLVTSPGTRGQDLGRELLQRKIGTQVRFGPGQVLWSHGVPADYLILVLSGAVRVLMPALDSDSEAVDLALPGDFGNLPDILSGAAAFGSGVAFTTGRALQIEVGLLRQLSRQDPELAWMLACKSAEQSGMLRMRVMSLTAGSVGARLARLMCWLARRVGMADARGVFIPLKFTNRDMASMVGCRVETVIRIMGQWKRSGLVMALREGLVLSAPDTLHALCETALLNCAREVAGTQFIHRGEGGVRACASTA